jgi:hypothetical protein
MIRLLLICTSGCISTRSFYPLWIRASDVTLVFWASTLTAADSRVAQGGLTLILVMLLIGGVLLFILGIWDLVGDLRRFFRMRSEKKSHA